MGPGTWSGYVTTESRGLTIDIKATEEILPHVPRDMPKDI